MIKAYSTNGELSIGEVVYLAKAGNGSSPESSYHFCEPFPLAPAGDPFDEVLHGWFDSPANGRSFAGGTAVITAGPFPGTEDRCGDATAFYSLERCA